MNRYAEDLASFIRGLGLQKSHVVGSSYGAYTALVLAAMHPELVRSLTIGEPPILPWLEGIEGGFGAYGKLHDECLGPFDEGFPERGYGGRC